MLSRALSRILGGAEWRLIGNDLSGLRVITPNIPTPTQAEVDAEIVKIQAEDAAASDADAAADSEFAGSFFNGKTYDEISTIIDNALYFPDKVLINNAIDALPESTSLKNILKKMASAILEEGVYMKALARNLAAALKKAKYIE